MTTPAGRGAAANIRTHIFTPIGRDTALACGFFEENGIGVAACDGVTDLLELIGPNHGPLLVDEEALNGPAVETMIQRLDSQPNWSDIPVVIIAARRTRSGRLRNATRRWSVTFLTRPIDKSTLLSVMHAALESRRKQFDVRDLLHHLQGLNARLEKRSRQLQRLTLQLSMAEQAERERIARVLHDHLQQLLVGAKMNLGVLLLRRHKREALEENIHAVKALIGEAIEESRSLSRELSPPILQHSGLAAALEWLARDASTRHGLRVRLDMQANAPELPDNYRVFLFQSIRELLFNTVKHAGVEEARVELTYTEDTIDVTISDEGTGFDAGALRPEAGEVTGFGLFTIEERTQLLGGRFEIASRPGEGSRFTLSMPLPADQQKSAEVEDDPQTLETLSKPTLRSRLRVVIADDHEVVRQGLVALLSEEPNIEVAGVARDGIEVVDVVRKAQPDVVLMDVSMPNRDGVSATEKVHREAPQVAIIGLSVFEKEDIAERMLEAGARAYISKTAPAQELLAAIRDCYPILEESPKAAGVV